MSILLSNDNSFLLGHFTVYKTVSKITIDTHYKIVNAKYFANLAVIAYFLSFFSRFALFPNRLF